MSIIPAWPIGNPSCWEDLSSHFCNIFHKPLDAIQAPLQSYFDIWFLVIVWGTFMVVLLLRSQNPMLVGAVGVVIAFTIPTLNAKAVGIGMLLIAISIGITLYQLYQQRAQYPVT